jgi:hypothetical protein
MRALAHLDRMATKRLPWWAYNGGLLLFGLVTLAASWALSPGDDPRWTYLPTGAQFGDTCAFVTATGRPCPQCGMTRSFVWAARGHLVEAFRYSPGGLGLFLWIEVGALVGAVRLALRAPNALTPPWQLTVSWALGWIVLLYAVPWFLRAFLGLAPLP